MAETDKNLSRKCTMLLAIAVFFLGWAVWVRSDGTDGENSPLAEAVERDDVKAARVLLQDGANPNSPYILPGRKIRSPFWIDVSDRWALLEPVAAKFDHPQRENLLWVAAWHNKPEIVSVLLQHGANPNLLTDDKASALTIAAGNGNANIVKLLIDAGANVNYRNRYGDTALGRAIGNVGIDGTGNKGNKKIGQNSDGEEFLMVIRLLIAAKANVNTPMGWGWEQTPLAYARTHKMDMVAGLLKKAGAK